MKTQFKLITLILVISMPLYNCSNDNDNENSIFSKWIVTLAPNCENSQNRTPYCVTEAEFNRLERANACVIITLTDIFGDQHQGAPLSRSFYEDGTSCD